MNVISTCYEMLNALSVHWVTPLIKSPDLGDLNFGFSKSLGSPNLGSEENLVKGGGGVLSRFF